MKKFTKIILILSIVIVLALTSAAGLYWYNWQQNAPVAAVDIEALPKSAEVGAPVKIKVKVQTPWYRDLEKSVSLDDNINASLARKTTIYKEGMNLHGNLWTVEVSVLLFEEGAYSDLKLRIPLSADREKKQSELVIELPELTATMNAIAANSEIALKKALDDSSLTPEQIAAQEESQLWIWLLGGALIAALASFFLFRRVKVQQVRVLSSWEVAIQSLHELKKELSLNEELFFVRLTDILRQYIEKRFSLPATEKTSEEFIQQVRGDSTLSQKQQIALESFLSTGDLVKFARMAVDLEVREDCLSMADNFVQETIPVAEAAS